MADPPTDYVAYWPMDGSLAPGGGTPTGSPGYVTGKVGSALDLANSTGVVTEYVTLSANPLTQAQMRAGWTVAAWVQNHVPTATHGTSLHTAFNLAITGSADIIAFGSNTSAGVSCTFYNNTVSSGVDQSPAVALTADTWTHIAATWNGTTMALYRNGTATGTAAAAHTTGSSATYTIGVSNISTSLSYWWGLIDELRVYAYALTAQQVLDCNNFTGSTTQLAYTPWAKMLPIMAQ